MLDKRLFRSTSKFSVYKEIVKYELENLEMFIQESAYGIQKRETGLTEFIQTVENIREHEGTDLDNFIQDQAYELERVFILNTYNPLLLRIYGFFEFWLKKCCELDALHGLSLIQIKDLAGANYIDKSRRYLTLVAHLDLKPVDKVWQKILEVQKIRNCIAHKNANIFFESDKPMNKQTLYSLVNGNPSITFEERTGDFYIADKKYLLDILKMVQKYLNFVIDKLLQRKVVARNTVMSNTDPAWGELTADNSLLSIIQILAEMDKLKDIHQDNETKEILSRMDNRLEELTEYATKFLSFFGNAKWEPTDVNRIMEDRQNGLLHLRSAYNIASP